jgi:hypothetical protein
MLQRRMSAILNQYACIRQQGDTHLRARWLRVQVPAPVRQAPAPGGARRRRQAAPVHRLWLPELTDGSGVQRRTVCAPG